MKQALREALGKAVRDEWVRWASEQPNPKPSHLEAWETLNEQDKEVDRRIGEAAVLRFMDLMVATITPVVFSSDDKEFQDAAKFLEGQSSPQIE